MRQSLLFIAGLASIVTATQSRASLMQTNSENDAGSTAFAVSATDLVNQGRSTLASSSNGNFTPYGTSSPTVLNDGTAGTGGVNAGESSVSIQTGDWTLTYNLNTAGGGYNISEIDTVSWWNSDYVNQSYTLAYSTPANPTSFTNTLGSFSLAATAGQSTIQVVALKIALTDTTGTLLSNVAGLQFTFHNIADAGYGSHQGGYREVDVIGTQVAPEPASAGLLALPLLGLLRRRQRLVRGNRRG